MSKAKYIALGASALLVAGVVTAVAGGQRMGGPGMGGPGMGGRGMVMQRFNEADTNNDQVVTREEAKTAHDKKFAGMDADKDGSVSIAEIDAVIQKRLVQMGVRMRYHMLARLDKDGDGSVNKNEFDDRGTRHFQKADRDGDGQITLKEARRMHRKMGRGMRHMRGGMRHKGGGHMRGHMRHGMNHMGGGYMRGHMRGHMGGGYMGRGNMRGHMGGGMGPMGGNSGDGQTGSGAQE